MCSRGCGAAAAVRLAAPAAWGPGRARTESAFLCRPCPARAKCADPSAKKCLVMDADDEAVLNLIAECEWGLSNPPGSSSQKERESDFHGPHGARLPPPRATAQPGAQTRSASQKSCL